MDAPIARLIDVAPAALEKGLGAIESSLARLVKKERLTADDAQAIRARAERAEGFALTKNVLGVHYRA